MSGEIQKLLHKGLVFLFPKNCFEEIVLNFHIFHDECMRLVLSRFLGLGITVGALLIFVPQIIKIWRAKSGAGISLTAQLLSLVAATGTAGYSYASKFVFSQWGDALFISIQTAIIIMQILIYSGRAPMAAAFLAVCWAVTMGIVTGYVPFWFLTTLQASTIPITFIARLLQATENYRNKSTGQLSAVSVLLQFLGSMARIFTSMQETGDKLIIASYGVASVMNGIIFAQLLMYWSRQPAKKKTQ
uniref:Mannose-P-dolichol utilization defect 1 protein homolog n=1 Tax=Plectus sambesii TaxID=2011161 RepID=A0A914VAK6_9BILA